MAIETLGIRMVISGASRVARDISHVALSLYNYGKAVNQVDRALIRISQGAVNRATAALGAQQRVVNTLTNAYNRQSAAVNGLRATFANIQGRSAGLAASQAQLRASEIQLHMLRVAYGVLRREMARQTFGSAEYGRLATMMFALNARIIDTTTETRRLRGVTSDATRATRQLAAAGSHLTAAETVLSATQVRLNSEMEKSARIETDLENATEQLRKSIATTSGPLGALVKFFSVLTGHYARNVIGATQLDKKLLQMGMSFAAAGLALNVLTIALDAMAIAVKLAVGTLKLLFDIFKKILSIVWNVGVGIAKGVVGVLKTLVAIPFRIAAAGLNSIWQSIKRIGEIAIGMNLANLIWHIGAEIKKVGERAFTAASEFQFLELRLTGLVAREIAGTDTTKSISAAMGEAAIRSKELTYWISELAVQSPFGATEIARTLSLAMSYDIAEKDAKSLTHAILNFATGMGLGNEEMVRIVENLGQMKAQGKITGMELRDLARGAFVPVNRVLQIMGESLGLAPQKIGELRTSLQDMASSGEISIDEFSKAFIKMSEKDFPNAVGRMSSTWKTARSNIDDFIETVLGWRVLTPMVAVLGETISNFIAGLMSKNSIKVFERIGEALGLITKFAIKLANVKFGGVNIQFDKLALRLNVVYDLIKNIVGLRRAGMDTAFGMRELAFRLSQFGLALPVAQKLAKPIVDLADAFTNLDSAPAEESVAKISKAVKEIADIVWTDILSPEWEKAKIEIRRMWDEWTKTLMGEFTKFWDNEVVPWWNSDGKTRVLTMIASISTWIEESTLLQDVGRKVTDGIVAGMQSARESGWIKTIENLLVAALSGAAAAAVNAMIGIITGASAVQAGAFSDQESQEEAANKPDWVRQREQTSPKGGVFAPIQAAIEDLKKTAQDALNTSLRELNTVIAGIVAGASGDYSNLNQFIQTVIVLTSHGAKVGEAFDQMAVAIQKLGGKYTENEEAFSGFAAFLDDFLTVSTFPIYAVANALTFLSDAVERWNNITTGAAVPFVGTTFEQADKMTEELIPTLEVDIRPSEESKKTFWENIGLQETIDNFKIAIDGLKKLFDPITKESEKTTKAVETQFSNLDTALISGSIIPDMLSSMYTAFSEEYANILAITKDNFIVPLTAMFKIDLAGAGKAAIQTLWDGMASMLANLKAWWDQNNHFTVTVTINEVTVGGKGGSGGKGKPDAEGAKGVNFVVPPGFPNDSFNLGVQTGEQVIVIPNAMRSFMSRQGSPNSMWSYGNAGVSNINNSRATTNNYYLNVNNANRELETIQTEFGIMRLVGE